MKLKTVSETDYFLSDSVNSREFVIFSAKKMSSSVETTSEPGSTSGYRRDDIEGETGRLLKVDFHPDGSVTVRGLGPHVTIDMLIAWLGKKKLEEIRTKNLMLKQLNERIHSVVHWSKIADKVAREIIKFSLSPEERSAIEADRAEAKRHRAGFEMMLRNNQAVQAILINELVSRRQEAVEVIARIDAELAREWEEEQEEE